MARNRKEYRELTISEACSYGRNPAPQLRIQGLWMKDLGFNIGDAVRVKCEDGRLVISLDGERADRLEAKKMFLEGENKKLRNRYEKEKEEIYKNYVAEHRESYGR